jgi:hypothetical protein
MYQIYDSLIHPLNHSPSYLPPQIPGVISARIIFAITCRYIHFIALYLPFYSLFPTLSPQGSPHPTEQKYFCSPVL